MKNINWKLRLMNKYTLTAIVSAIALFVNNILQAFGLDYAPQIEQYESVAGSIISVLVMLGVVVDGTSRGFKDTPLVQEYKKPRDPRKEGQQVEWTSNVGEKLTHSQVDAQKEIGMLEPKEYDTSEPFTPDESVTYDERLYKEVPEQENPEIEKEVDK